MAVRKDEESRCLSTSLPHCLLPVLSLHPCRLSDGNTRGWSEAELADGRYYDLEGHRGGRGEHSESTLAAFAAGLLDGVTTLEMDNGVTVRRIQV